MAQHGAPAPPALPRTRRSAHVQPRAATGLRASTPYQLLRAARPRDWVKNLFVFGALAFARDGSGDPLWTHPDIVLAVLATLALFCAAASAIYLLNDYVDVEQDRLHPRKRLRPLASGALRPATALATAGLLLVAIVPGALAIDARDGLVWRNVDLLALVALYLLVHGYAYSYRLKHVVILDVFTIASGFVVRVVAGAAAIDVPVTPWLLACTGLLALFLALAKRRAELVTLEAGAAGHRRILDEYSLPLLDQLLSIVTAATLIAYALFTYTSETLPREPFPTMMATVPIVAYALFRYLYLMHRRGSGGNPAELVLSDRPLAASVALWSIVSLAISLQPR
jgi:4-hydroxybenzoate polyprenyltransferase